MSDTEQLTHAIAAHGRWKSHLKRAIDAGTSEWSVNVVRTDNACEFGKWFHARTTSEKGTERWVKIRDLHAEFHKEAARILGMALAGQKAEAEAAMAPGSHFTRISADLTLALVKWRDSPPV